MTEISNHNDGPYTIILDKTTEEAYSIDAAIRKSHNFHSNVTENLQKYTDLKGEPIRMWQL